MSDWMHSEQWRRHGRDFYVELSRRDGGESFERGPNRWSLCAHFYPSHPCFTELDTAHPLLAVRSAKALLPGHSGPLTIEPQYDAAGCVVARRVVAPYSDTGYKPITFMSTPKAVPGICKEADALFDLLEVRALRHVPRSRPRKAA